MSTSQRSLLITDLDNTLYDFPTYYEAGLRAMVEEIAETLGIDENQVADQLREVFREQGTIEYAFAIENLRETRLLPMQQRQEFVARVLQRFWMGATSGLQPYTDVVYTLKHLAEQGVAIVAYSDAPVNEAIRRLKCLGIAGYMTGIVAQRWRRRRPGTVLAMMKQLPGLGSSPRVEFIWRIGGDERKPNSAIYERIVAKLGARASSTTVIGDSIDRDLMPAHHLGLTCVWARYGRRSSIHGRLLSQVVPFVLPEVSRTEPSIPPAIHVADRFSDVVCHLPVQQLLPLD